MVAAADTVLAENMAVAVAWAVAEPFVAASAD